MTTAADRPSSPRYFSNRPPISYSSYCCNTTPGLMYRSLDETRFNNNRRIPECHQHSTPVPTGNTALFTQNTQSTSSPHFINRRRPTSTSNMTSYSALKRKAQRSDISSNFQVNLEHVLGFTSLSNSVVSQDHSTIAYAAGSTVVLYDINTQKQDFIINTARKAITSLSLSPDGRYLATGECGHDPKVRIWDLTGDKTVCIELGDHKFAIDCVCFSPNVDRLVSIGSVHDGNIYVWNWKDKKKLASNKCTCAIRRIAFAEDGSYFVTVGNRHVKFWYLIPTSSLEVVPLRGRYAILAERKDNFFVDVICGRGDCAGMTYVITSNGLICQFDEQRQMRAERDLQEKTNCLAIGDLYLVVGCVQGAVYIFSPQTLDYIMSIPLPHYLGVDIAFIKSTDQMISSQQQNRSFPDTIAVCLDEDKSILTCFYNDHSFYIWDIKNERAIKKRDSHMYHSGCGWGIETHSQTNTSSSVLRQLSCITCSSDNSIRFWTLNHNESDSMTPSSSSNIFSRQLMKIVYLDDDYSKLCDSQTTQDRPEFVPKIGGRCMKVNPDGLSIAIGDRNGNIRIFNLETFQQIALVEAHDSEVLSVDYSHPSSTDMTFLASSSRDRFIHIFDVNKHYQLVTTLDDHSAAITAIRFTYSSITSNLQLISCGADKSLIFRSISKNENGKYQFIRSNNIVEKQTFYDLAIDHTRELVSTACQDRMIRVYNLQDGKRVRTCKGTIGDDPGYLIKIDIDKSGRYLATSCSNKYVYIWDTITIEYVASLCGHSEIITDLKFSQDGNYLYTISGDSCIFVWNITELAIAPTTCRIPPVSSMKSTDLETTETDESISQTPSIIEEHQPNMKRPRSLWATAGLSVPSFESKFIRSQLPDIVNDDSCSKMFQSTSSQDDESVFLDEETDLIFSAVSTSADSTTEKLNTFFAENYDHENVTICPSINNEVIPSNEMKRRKSVSSRFRSVSKDPPLMTDTLSTSVNTNQDDLTSIPPTATNRQSKYLRPQAMSTSTTTNESKTGPSKPLITRGMRVNRTRSEDRFRGSTHSLLNNSGDTTSSSSHSQLPSYAAHTSSSMKKLRDNSTSTIPPQSAPPLLSSSTSNPPLTIPSSQTRRIPSTVTSLSTKNIPKSRSTQNLILPTTNTSNSTTQSQLKTSSRQLKASRLPRRPPNLPSSTINNQVSSSSSSSSSSSNSSSPTKTKQHLPTCLQETVLPLNELDNSPNDLMPKWAQDCFYRTVVLGLKPLLLQDIPSSPMKHSTSTSSIETSDSLEVTSEILLINQKDMQIRRSISIPDYKQIETTKNKENNSISNDNRMPIVNHLANDLHKHLNELETLYATVSQSSEKSDVILKQYIEQIFSDLHRRITDYHQQQNLSTTVINN